MSDPRIIRMVSSPASGQPDSNPTVDMLLDSLPDHCRVDAFTWRRAFGGRYDILHVHWPEYFVQDRSLPRLAIKSVRLLALFALNRLRRRRSVITIHNLESHEPLPRLGEIALRGVHRLTDSHVYMYRGVFPPGARPFDVAIKRGDYRPLYGEHVDAAPRRSGSDARHVLQFGLVRPYKGVEDSIAAFSQLPPGFAHLLVAGNAKDPAYAETITNLAAATENADALLKHLSDDELAAQVQRADAVLLPYRKMYNSGAALLALTLGTPIIVPSSITMRELQSEVGPEWVLTYEGELTAATLNTTLANLGPRPSEPPLLSERAWPLVGQQHAQLYRALIDRDPDMIAALRPAPSSGPVDGAAPVDPGERLAP